MNNSIFISWSGPLAGEVAQLLKTLVEDSLGTGDVFISKEIEGGARWSHEIPRQLDECADGLVVVTSENHAAPWLHFEAGALSKHVEASHVTPLLFDAEIGEIQGTPLSLFQAKRMDEKDLRQLMLEMGRRREKDDNGVRRRFGHAWADFEASISGLKKTVSKSRRKLNTDDLGAMIESLSAQVSRIVKPEHSVAAAIVGQGQLATAGPAEAAALLAPYLSSMSPQTPSHLRTGLLGARSGYRNALAAALEQTSDLEPAQVNALLTAFRDNQRPTSPADGANRKKHAKRDKS